MVHKKKKLIETCSGGLTRTTNNAAALRKKPEHSYIARDLIRGTPVEKLVLKAELQNTEGRKTD